MILDIHHHGSVSAEAITSISADEEMPDGEGYLSVGIHPWKHFNPAYFVKLAAMLCDPRVVALGEAGVDRLRGDDLDYQIKVFKVQMILSEQYRLPLVIHSVRSSDIIMGLRSKFKPTMPWIFHGFRGKPAAAEQLLKSGVRLSFGEKFNPSTVVSVPDDKLLVETDMSAKPIDDIISEIANLRNQDVESVKKTVVNNALMLFGK